MCLCLCYRKTLLAQELNQEKQTKYRETIISEVDNLRASGSLLNIRAANGEEQANQRRGVRGRREVQAIRSNVLFSNQ